MKTPVLTFAPMAVAALRPLAAVIGLFLLAMVVLSGTASLANAPVSAWAATAHPATLAIPASLDEWMAALGQ